MEKDMPQECTTIAEDWHKRAPILTTHWSKLASTRRLKRAPTSGEMRQYGKGYAPRMHQGRRRLAQMCRNFDHPLEQACISNKNDKKLSKPTFLHLSDIIFHGTEYVSIVLYTDYAKDHLPKSNRREKAAKWTNMAAKQVA